MSRRLAVAGWLCFFVLLFSATMLRPAYAEPDKAEAVELLGEGDALLAKGDRYMDAGRAEKALESYEDALKLYRQAYQAFPNPKIYFPIATAEQKLGRYLEAMQHYQEVIRDSKNPSAELLAEVNRAIASVRKKLVALDLVVKQDGATITIDGKVLGMAPLEGPHYMAPGEHKYSVSLEGYATIEEVLDLAPGKVVKRKVRLKPIAIGKLKSSKSSKSSKRPQDKGLLSVVAPSKTPMTVAFSAAGAFALGATFSAIQAKVRHDTFEDKGASVMDRENARDSGKTYALATDILAGCALVSASYGLYYYYATYKPGKEEASASSRSALYLVPYSDGTQAGLVLGSSF